METKVHLLTVGERERKNRPFLLFACICRLFLELNIAGQLSRSMESAVQAGWNCWRTISGAMRIERTKTKSSCESIQIVLLWDTEEKTWGRAGASGLISATVELLLNREWENLNPEWRLYRDEASRIFLKVKPESDGSDGWSRTKEMHAYSERQCGVSCGKELQMTGYNTWWEQPNWREDKIRLQTKCSVWHIHSPITPVPTHLGESYVTLGYNMCECGPFVNVAKEPFIMLRRQQQYLHIRYKNMRNPLKEKSVKYFIV